MTRIIKSISATVSPNALGKATRFFNATLADILNELLQNARRAGAGEVFAEETETGYVISDDGRGIADPAALLAFGASFWDETIARLEDAAGMGFWSLSRRGCAVSSRPEGSPAGWHAEISPDVFAGEAAADLIEDPDIERGTTIFIPKSAHDDVSLEYALARAGEFYPLPIILRSPDPEASCGYCRSEIERKDFLGDAVAVVRFGSDENNGGRIGVIPSRRCGPAPTMNFHGVTLSPSTPRVSQQLDGPVYQAIYDFHGGAGIELVLPARKEIVHNDAWRAQQKKGRDAIFAHIVKQGDHRLAFKDYDKAIACGHRLAEAVRGLTPWSPPENEDGAYYGSSEAPVPENALLVDVDADPVVLQCMAHALDGAGFDAPLFAALPAYQGYTWYDALPRIVEVEWRLKRAGDEVVYDYLDDFHAPSIEAAPSAGDADSDDQWRRPDAIVMRLTIERRGGREISEFETDVLLFGEGYSADEIDVIVTNSALEANTVDPEMLAELMVKSYFSPSDDADADSYRAQRSNYEIAAYARACEALIGKEAADLAFIRDHAIEGLSWACPRGRRVVIVIEDYKVEAAFRDARLEDAAGELLSALKKTLPVLESHIAMTGRSDDMSDRLAYDAALAAIAKATTHESTEDGR